MDTTDLRLRLRDKPNCCLFLEGSASFLEFQQEQKPSQGFALSQLVQYTVESVAAKDGPPEKLSLCFSTADVVITGWRLDRLVSELRCHKGGIVKTLPNAARYEQLEPNACAIASIDIKPVGKE
jgi:hypothetical protein